MNSTRFDELSRTLARDSSRRGALRTLAAGVAGGLLGLFGARAVNVGAAPPCRDAGERCTSRADCCFSLTCQNGVCGCPAGSALGPGGGCICASNGFAPCNGTCCPSGSICQNGACACPSGTTPVSGACVCAGGCNAQTCPSGCCQGGTCVSPSLSACGTNGATCVACDPATADNCTGGVCRCGSGPACGAGQTCVSHQCVTGGCTPGSTRSCYTGPVGTQGVGICHAGVQTCQPDGTWGACVGEVTPQPEICGNGLDDDCDGVVDNGCAGCPAGAIPCGVTCCAPLPNTVVTCNPATSTCSYTCAPGFFDCDSNLATGCECEGTGCCGSACQTKHMNGVGQNYFDCSPLGVPGNPTTYMSTMANEAANAYAATAAGTSISSGTCGTAGAVLAQNALTCVVWVYTGSLAGYVRKNPTLNTCQCPALGDAVWN